MTGKSNIPESPATSLCKSCGLCCTGHLFIWTKLRSVELDPIQDLGVNVFREPGQRGFNQPCPLWDDQCTIYDSPHYPRFCRTYKCKLLNEVVDGIVPLPDALSLIVQVKEKIKRLETLLPGSSNPNFRERLVSHLESLEVLPAHERQPSDQQFILTARELLAFYEMHFGVKDLLDKPGEV